MTKQITNFFYQYLPVIIFSCGLGILGLWADHHAPASTLNQPAPAQFTAPQFSPADPFPRQIRDARGVLVRLRQRPQRIVSADWAMDEFLFSLVPPERIAGVSNNAYVERVSNLTELVNRFHPVVANDPERVIRAQPDLVLISADASPDFGNLVTAAGIPVFRISSNFHSLAEIQATITLVGYLTGEDTTAARERAEFAATTAKAPTLAKTAMRPRVLGISGGFTYGAGTLFDDIIRTIGAVNVGAEQGLKGYDSASPEQIVRWNPDWIVTGADSGKSDAVRRSLLENPSIAATNAAKKGQIIVEEFRVFLPMSPLSKNLVQDLAARVHGQ